MSRAAVPLWIETTLGLKARSFRVVQWPVVEEVLQALAARRPSGGKRSREAIHENLLVHVRVRGRALLVKNTVHSLVLALDLDEEVANLPNSVLHWLVQQFRENLGSHNAQERGIIAKQRGGISNFKGHASAASSSIGPPGTATEQELTLRLEARDKILLHGIARECHWCPSKDAV
eukprot:NODE_16213_length_1006_cov_4.506257.p1 GENE.NODE_16213_length_1006_cov_4.506257~~NODE_16213_length_1006_cov_4.506257.p1  ORF type:complete len:176 (+),score=49.94 NODE_16213_length_1006_cov_4.506257:218-745(+)